MIWPPKNLGWQRVFDDNTNNGKGEYCKDCNCSFTMEKHLHLGPAFGFIALFGCPTVVYTPKTVMCFSIRPFTGIKERRGFDYFFIPYEKHTLDTNLTSTELEAKFNAVTALPAPSLVTPLVYNISGLYEGEFFTGEFYMRRRLKKQDVFTRYGGMDMVFYHGTVLEEDGKTLIILKIRLSTIAQPGYFAILIFSLFFMSVGALTLLQKGKEKESFMIFGVCIFFHLIYSLIFKWKSASGLDHIKKMFEMKKTDENS